MLSWFRQRRRRKLISTPFPTAWMLIVQERLPFWADLPEEHRDPFLQHLRIFVEEKEWVAAGGLDEVTEEMKVVVAGCAARIARRLPWEVYDRLVTVVIYPTSFTDDDPHTEILGVAHKWGTVVLSWDSVRHGIGVTQDGRDTAVHEFAHVLDFEDGEYDGTPLLHDGAHYHDWSVALGRHFADLQKRPMSHFLRAYGATNEAEFFAVATEAFFEKPKVLRRKAPEMYDELRRFFRVDPASD